MDVKYLKDTAARYAEVVALNQVQDLSFYYLTDPQELYLGKVKKFNIINLVLNI